MQTLITEVRGQSGKNPAMSTTTLPLYSVVRPSLAAGVAWLEHCVSLIRRLAQRLATALLSRPADALSHQMTTRQIEDYPLGYPQFSALVGAHSAFSLFRRFTVARSRLLLMKQDHVAVLESQLRELDEQEQRPLFLGSFRRDRNVERENLLSKLDKAMADYDDLIERNSRMLQLPAATDKNRSSLINWIEGTGCICRKEASFLFERDLCAPFHGSPGDSDLATIESFVEKVCVRFCQYLRRRFKKISSRAFLYVYLPCKPTSTMDISRDDRVFIFSGSNIKMVARLIITWLLLALLLGPVVIVQAIQGVALQILCIMLASGIFVFVLSNLIRTRMAEIFVAGATYAALLVAFVSGSLTRD